MSGLPGNPYLPGGTRQSDIDGPSNPLDSMGLIELYESLPEDRQYELARQFADEESNEIAALMPEHNQKHHAASLGDSIMLMWRNWLKRNLKDAEVLAALAKAGAPDDR